MEKINDENQKNDNDIVPSSFFNQQVTSHPNKTIRSNLGLTGNELKIWDVILSNIFNVLLEPKQNYDWIMISKSELYDALETDYKKSDDKFNYIVKLINRVSTATNIKIVIDKANAEGVFDTPFEGKVIAVRNYYCIAIKRAYLKIFQARTGDYSKVARIEMKQLKSKFAINLYQNLRTYYNYKKFLIDKNKKIYCISLALDDLLVMFGQKRDSYSIKRKNGTNQFNWSAWANRTLVPSTTEINSIKNGSVKFQEFPDGKLYEILKMGKENYGVKFIVSIDGLNEQASAIIDQNSVISEIRKAYSKSDGIFLTNGDTIKPIPLEVIDGNRVLTNTVKINESEENKIDNFENKSRKWGDEDE